MAQNKFMPPFFEPATQTVENISLEPATQTVENTSGVSATQTVENTLKTPATQTVENTSSTETGKTIVLAQPPYAVQNQNAIEDTEKVSKNGPSMPRGVPQSVATGVSEPPLPPTIPPDQEDTYEDATRLTYEDGIILTTPLHRK